MPLPFPALTPGQRLLLDVNGYVVIEGMLPASQVEELQETIYRFEAAYRETGELPGPDCHLSSTSQELFRIDNLPHLASCFFDYLTNPRIVGLAEEIVGGRVRLEQSDAHIRRPDNSTGGRKYGFHRGLHGGYFHTVNGLYHFPFIKALTNLTDLGPDDGGTTVIAGTHKLLEDVDAQAVIDAALADECLIHHVEAPAGSTLLFFESLFHSHGIIRSGRDRLLILGGFTPTMFQPWHGYEPSPAFLATLPDESRALLTGEARYGWNPRSRDLDTEAE